MSFYDVFNKIKRELKELYLRDAREWVVGVSFGKDSTMMLLLIWEMLEGLSESQRTKKVHVITSNTEVEEPYLERYIKNSVKRLTESAENKKLPIIPHLVTPSMKNNYYWNVLGKGNPPVSYKSRFRWCSSKLKINPINDILDYIIKDSAFRLGDQYDILLHLGVRDSESASRTASINKFQLEDKFARHQSRSNVLVYHTIKELSGSEIWGYFYDFEVFPWGTLVSELQEFYPENIFECSIKTDGEQGNSCGNGRNGCYVCTAVKEDKMMKDLVIKDPSLQPLYDYKLLLAEIRNDARYRMPLKRKVLKKAHKRLIEEDLKKNQLDLLDDGLLDYHGNQLTQQKQAEYEHFDRADDVEYSPGSFTIEARILLTRKLLAIQEQTGFELIGANVVEAIIKVWQEEGYKVTQEQVTPLDWQYDGAIVFDGEGSLNKQETTNENPQYWVHRDFSLGRDELVEYLERKEQETCQSFFYYINHCDMGEDEAFAWNIAYFLVAADDVDSEKKAFKKIEEWLYEPQPTEEMDWDRFATRYYQKAEILMEDPYYDLQKLIEINKVLVTLGKEPVKPSRSLIKIEENCEGQFTLAI
ncbi:adenine nucleotide alpha hydrolase family protein [Rossellomorea arthrocnemi]|uniref:hypothetical protein n=1 Tax=Rossellomorea arthrocnemi TaxID=2769542 RepID=UPI00191B564E|nr:hypothetical protein [Rossellomorea arthrocnemi]